MTASAPFLKALKLAALTLTTLVLVSGCGFQLRGTSPVPAALQPLAVDCPDNLPGRFCQSVRDQLTLGGVEVADSATEADYVLRLRDYRQDRRRSEEHTSELQSRPHLVCRLLLEKKNI